MLNERENLECCEGLRLGERRCELGDMGWEINRFDKQCDIFCFSVFYGGLNLARIVTDS